MNVSNPLWRTVGRINYRLQFAKQYRDRRDVVIVYHAVGDPDAFGNVSVDRFRRDIDYLRDEYELVRLRKLLSDPNRTDSKRVAITFDDGYENFYHEAFPIVSEREVPVTLFIPDAVAGGEDFELVRERLGVPTEGRAFLSESQVRSCLDEDIVDLGNHGRTHANLAEITDEQRLEREIVEAKEHLEDRFDTTIATFAYPYGQYNQPARRVVERSHTAAVTSDPGGVSCEQDRYRIPRISGHLPHWRLQWEVTDLAEVFRKVNNRLR